MVIDLKTIDSEDVALRVQCSMVKKWMSSWAGASATGAGTIGAAVVVRTGVVEEAAMAKTAPGVEGSGVCSIGATGGEKLSRTRFPGSCDYKGTFLLRLVTRLHGFDLSVLFGPFSLCSTTNIAVLVVSNILLDLILVDLLLAITTFIVGISIKLLGAGLNLILGLSNRGSDLKSCSVSRTQSERSKAERILKSLGLDYGCAGIHLLTHEAQPGT